MSEWKLRRAVRRALALRLGGVAILLCGIFTAIAWVNASARLEQAVTALARVEANRFARTTLPLLSNPATPVERWQEALRELATDGAATELAGGRFVLAKVFSADGYELAGLDDPNFPGIDRLRAAADNLDFDPPRDADYRAYSRRLDDQTYVATAVALRDQAGTIRGWLGGAFAVSPTAIAEMRSNVIRTLLYVVAVVLVTALALFPVISTLVNRLAGASVDLLDANLETIQVLGSAIAKRDSDTDAHNYRVAVYSVRLGQAAGMADADIPALIKGALLHDVGKLGIRDNVLLKPGKLTDEEFEIMKSHVEHGLDITSRARWLADAGDVVGGHHEKFDGAGYPRGLVGTAIPLGARIFAIADVFDALTSERPYKKPLPLSETLATMEKGRGKHFEPALLDCFNGIAADLYARYGDPDGKVAKDELQGLLDQYFRGRLPGLGPQQKSPF
jgi:HD-GYP domain-containing protein (c-di-GMP phosphodiesterase class II)